MPLQLYTIPEAKPEANEQLQPELEQPIMLPSHPEITSINQIFRLEEVEGLTLHNDTPENRLVYVFIANILGQSQDHVRQSDKPITNSRVESFLEKVIHYLDTVDDFDNLVLIMYGDWTPPRAVFNDHLTKVFERIRLARIALKANDPQLCMSILYNHVIRYDQLPTYRSNNRNLAVDEQDTFGVNADTQPNTLFVLLDSAFHFNRFLCKQDRVFDRVLLSFNTRGEQPDGFLEDIPHELLEGEPNLMARVHDMRTQEISFTAEINQIVQIAGQSTLSDLHACLIRLIDLWGARGETPNFRHPDLPPPPIVGSINFHRTATADQVLMMLSARCQKVRSAHDAVNRVLPEQIRDFIAEYPADERMGSATLNEEELRVFVALAEMY